MSGYYISDHKRITHYEEPGHVRELTFSCYRHLPLLDDDSRRKILVVAIDRAMLRHHFRLAAFVLMPEHVHLMVFPLPGASGMPELLRAIKRPSSFRMKQQMAADRRLLEQLTVRQRPGVWTFRFWQEGPGYDRNLFGREATEAAIEYFHCNPVRRGLVERATDWSWSSARWYAGLDYHPSISPPQITKLPPHWFDEVS